MIRENRPSVGFAFSGSGNRSTFYIGFLEALDEAKIPVDFISACSGGSLVAAVYAAGALEEFKREVFSLTPAALFEFLGKAENGGGLYSLQKIEQKVRDYIGSLTFEEARVKMCFVAVDIDNGEQVQLCMGDVARAACISCALPGVFEPTQWGSRTLVDGGLVSQLPADVARQAGMDIVVGVNMQGTKGIFNRDFLKIKKAVDALKYLFFYDEIEAAFRFLLKPSEGYDPLRSPGILKVIGRSLEIGQQPQNVEEMEKLCDLVIQPPPVPRLKKIHFSPSTLLAYYKLGRQTGRLYAPKIRALIEQKKGTENAN